MGARLHCSDLRVTYPLEPGHQFPLRKLLLPHPSVKACIHLNLGPSNDHISCRADASFVNTSQFNFLLYPVPFHTIPGRGCSKKHRTVPSYIRKCQSRFPKEPTLDNVLEKSHPNCTKIHIYIHCSNGRNIGRGGPEWHSRLSD